MSIDFNQQSHRRLNPLTGEWVLVSPHRTQRPWQGNREAANQELRPHHDDSCYLCAGNSRANGQVNPNYTDTFVFTNDFAALNPGDDQALEAEAQSHAPFMQNVSASGECRVICYSPRHDLTLTEMPLKGIQTVIDRWQGEYTELVQHYAWVQIFENKGATMGCSNPHPHGQIWASHYQPTRPAQWEASQKAWLEEKGSLLLVDYARHESTAGERVVEENDSWIAVVPYWAAWPYEILLLPKRHIPNMACLSALEKERLASILKRLLTRYDNLFETIFPYSMGWYQSMQQPNQDNYWQLCAQFMPPLLRSATVKKFMVGYEFYGETQRDITPEQAALNLRTVSATEHFKNRI